MEVQILKKNVGRGSHHWAMEYPYLTLWYISFAPLLLLFDYCESNYYMGCPQLCYNHLIHHCKLKPSRSSSSSSVSSCQTSNLCKSFLLFLSWKPEITHHIPTFSLSMLSRSLCLQDCEPFRLRLLFMLFCFSILYLTFCLFFEIARSVPSRQQICCSSMFCFFASFIHYH